MLQSSEATCFPRESKLAEFQRQPPYSVFGQALNQVVARSELAALNNRIREPVCKHRKIDVTLSQSARVMCAERNLDPVVDIEPLGMMINTLGVKRQPRHKTECRIEIGETILSRDRIATLKHVPVRHLAQRFDPLLRGQLFQHEHSPFCTQPGYRHQCDTHNNRILYASLIKANGYHAWLIQRRLKVKQNNRSDTWKRGLQARQEVLGADYVQKAFDNADELTRDLQDYLTEHAWGAVWTRPGLARNIRSMINLAMLTALNRPHELEIHVRGALNNGVSREEIKEVLLQTAVYCGAPAAIDAFRVARKVLSESER